MSPRPTPRKSSLAGLSPVTPPAAMPERADEVPGPDSGAAPAARCESGATGPLPGPRFLTLKDVQEELQISSSQALALVRSGELRAIQIGGRGQWRIERAMLEEFIAEAYRRADQRVGSAEDDA